MNIDQIKEIEPGVQNLEDYINHLEPGYDPSDVWAGRRGYVPIKSTFFQLVGWASKVPELKNSQAYDTVYFHFRKMLFEASLEGIK